MANEYFILVDSVDVYNKAFGLDTLHPLVDSVCYYLQLLHGIAAFL